jgi:polar amino acid transport system substrate-binding protein
MKGSNMQKLPCFLKRVSRAATFTLALCLSSLSFGAGPVLDRVVEQGVLRVAMSGDQQPFNFVFGKGKSVIGFDVDLAEALAGIMQLDLEVVRMPFDELITAVEDGKVDMVISGMTITPQRTRKVSFIGPYMLSGKSLLTTVKFMSKTKTSSGFNSSDVKLVALKGSTSETLVQQQLPKASLTVVANYDEGVQMLLAGKVNGMVADMPILALTKQRHRDSDLHLITPPLSTEPLGIAIARGDEQFENLLRNYLLAFEKTGLFVSLHKKWFEIGNRNIYEP